MINKKKVPDIRFKGFAEEWSKQSFNEVAKISSAARVHKNEWTDFGVPFFRSSDVVSAYKGESNKKVYISFDLYQILIQRSGKLNKKDILITGGGTIGIPYIILDDNPIYSKDADLIWIKLKEMLNSNFVYYYFFSTEFRKYINSISHIGTIAHYTIEQVQSTPIVKPIFNEQKQIGNYFQNVDRLINTSQAKLDKLKNIKKACLEKMFPQNGSNTPELRFKGFTDEWSTKFLADDEFDIVAGGDVDKDKLKPTGNYPVFANALVNDGIVGYYLDEYRITAPAVTVTGRGDVGYAKARKTNFTPVVRLLTIKSKHDVDYMGNAINKHRVLVESTGVPQLTVPQIKKYEIWFPYNHKEEEQIGLFLLKLNTIADFYDKKINKLKNIKKACLNKMFVNTEDQI